MQTLVLYPYNFYLVDDIGTSVCLLIVGPDVVLSMEKKIWVENKGFQKPQNNHSNMQNNHHQVYTHGFQGVPFSQKYISKAHTISQLAVDDFMKIFGGRGTIHLAKPFFG